MINIFLNLNCKCHAFLMLQWQAVANANETRRVGRTAVLCFQKWRGFANGEKCFKMKVKKALRWYDVQYMKRRVFVQWRDWVRFEQRSNYKERFQARLEEAQKCIQQEYEVKFSDLEKENTRLKKCLEEEGKARDLMEEDMKQAFMRGVCALNLEALTVMKRGVPPGVNPFPIAFPLKEDNPQQTNIILGAEEPSVQSLST